MDSALETALLASSTATCTAARRSSSSRLSCSGPVLSLVSAQRGYCSGSIVTKAAMKARLSPTTIA